MKQIKDIFDIIIQAGQSNSEGYGLGPATNPYIENELGERYYAEFSKIKEYTRYPSFIC